MLETKWRYNGAIALWTILSQMSGEFKVFHHWDFGTVFQGYHESDRNRKMAVRVPWLQAGLMILEHPKSFLELWFL